MGKRPIGEHDSQGLQVTGKSILASIPTVLDFSQSWLMDYWAGELGVSSGRLEQVAAIVGHDVAKVKKFLSEGHRIAICDERGESHLVMRISLEKGGIAVSVPYHPSKKGWLVEMPLQYDKTQFMVPVSDMNQYTVEDTVKLSLHMDGFVQFSTGGKNPIISGYNQELGEIKGIGLLAPEEVRVTTGPLFGAVVQGLDQFELQRAKQAEVFNQDDLWHHPEFSTPEDRDFNIEVFMFPKSELRFVETIGNRRMLTRKLPFKSQLFFNHHLRVVELPHLPFFLGVIVSRMRTDNTIASGYKLSGPGCGEPNKVKKSIFAMYPRPEFVEDQPTRCLDYRPTA